MTGIPYCYPPPFILLALAVFSPWGTAAAQDASLMQQHQALLAERDKLAGNVRVLENEVRLSREKRPYLVVNLPSKEIILKVHGLALKHISTVEVRRMGSSDCTTGAAVLEYFETDRVPKIRATGETDPANVIDVSDMPQSYELGFRSEDRLVSIYVRPASSTVLSKAWLAVSNMFASGGYAVRRVFGFKRPAYRLLLLPQDAQALFWALDKGSPAMFYL